MVYHYLKREAQIFHSVQFIQEKTLLQKETNNCTKLSFQETKRNLWHKANNAAYVQKNFQ